MEFILPFVWIFLETFVPDTVKWSIPNYSGDEEDAYDEIL